MLEGLVLVPVVFVTSLVGLCLVPSLIRVVVPSGLLLVTTVVSVLVLVFVLVPFPNLVLEVVPVAFPI